MTPPSKSKDMLRRAESKGGCGAVALLFLFSCFGSFWLARVADDLPWAGLLATLVIGAIALLPHDHALRRGWHRGDTEQGILYVVSVWLKFVWVVAGVVALATVFETLLVPMDDEEGGILIVAEHCVLLWAICGTVIGVIERAGEAGDDLQSDSTITCHGAGEPHSVTVRTLSGRHRAYACSSGRGLLRAPSPS